jgi:hypothetical protein
MKQRAVVSSRASVSASRAAAAASSPTSLDVDAARDAEREPHR